MHNSVTEILSEDGAEKQQQRQQEETSLPFVVGIILYNIIMAWNLVQLFMDNSVLK